MRRAVLLLAVTAVAGCGGGERQDAGEPGGTFKIEVVDSSFPARQHIAQSVQLRLRVRNADRRPLRNAAVTVETEAAGDNAPAAFGRRSSGAGLSDSDRPVWVLDRGPLGGDSAYVNTWSAGTLRAGESREMTWRLVAARAGTYAIGYRVAPGLAGRAQAAKGRSSGTFHVTIAGEPVPARVEGNGEVVRDEGPGGAD